jgi:phage terminase large subunit-like protein
LYRVGVGVDPSGGAGQCGIIGAGIAKIGRLEQAYTIADYSTPAGTPSSEWAIAVLRCYHAIGADFIAVERNFGGDMVANTIRTAELRDAAGHLLLSGKNIKIIEVSASRGKEIRAEPVSSLFQLGRAHHVGYYPELEKQWTKWQPGMKPSPDRMDAEVWVITELLVDDGKQKTARVLGRRR